MLIKDCRPEEKQVKESVVFLRWRVEGNTLALRVKNPEPRRQVELCRSNHLLIVCACVSFTLRHAVCQQSTEAKEVQ